MSNPFDRPNDWRPAPVWPDPELLDVTAAPDCRDALLLAPVDLDAQRSAPVQAVSHNPFTGLSPQGR